MDPPSLKLVIARGPRSGETLEFKPGSRVRVGRVVCGNDVAIKDPGISSKHLCIEVEAGKWVVRDLGSSNGTFLNFAFLPPGTPFDLREGDCIKLGEESSIVVNLTERGDRDKGHDGNAKLPPRPRRNNKRQVDPVRESLQSVATNRRRRGRPLKQSTGNEVLHEESRKGTVFMTVTAHEVAKVEKNLERSKNRGNSEARGSHKAGIVHDSGVGLENGSAQELRRSVRVLRSGRVVDGAVKEPEILVEQAERGVNRRITRQTKKEAVKNLALGPVKVEIDAGTKRRRRKGVRKVPTESAEVANRDGEEANLREEAPSDAEVDGKEEAGPETVSEHARNSSTDLGKGEAHDQPSREDGSTGLVRGSIVVKVERVSYCEVNVDHNRSETENLSRDKDDSGGELKMDLERMTLDELIDYMDAQFGKQIIEETEEMIDAMKCKAMRVSEYIRGYKGMGQL